MTDHQTLQVQSPPTAAPASAAAAPSAVAERPPWQRGIDFALRYCMLGVLLGLLVASTYLNDRFWDTDNLRNMLTQNTPIGLVAIGMTFVIIAGGFDLSVGAIFAFSTLLVADLASSKPIWLAVILTSLAGCLFGVANGTIITRFKVNSFIATIGTGAVISGLAFAFSDSQPIFVLEPGFDSLGLGRVAGIPWAALILVAFFLIGGFVLTRTVYGRWVFAVGGNLDAARLVGIRIDLVRISTFAIVGGLTALGACVLASQLGVGEPTLGGQTALDAFAIVVIGGTSVYGGQGALWRTATGLAVIAVMENLFNTLTLSNAHQSIATGSILIAALGLNALGQRRG